MYQSSNLKTLFGATLARLRNAWAMWITKDDDDVAKVKPIMQAAMERRVK